jgi:hypothetical protein
VGYTGRCAEGMAPVRQRGGFCGSAALHAVRHVSHWQPVAVRLRSCCGVPAGRDSAAQRGGLCFVEEMQRSGFVAQALRRHGLEGAAVAPDAKP